MRMGVALGVGLGVGMGVGLGVGVGVGVWAWVWVCESGCPCGCDREDSCHSLPPDHALTHSMSMAIGVKRVGWIALPKVEDETLWSTHGQNGLRVCAIGCNLNDHE